MKTSIAAAILAYSASAFAAPVLSGQTAQEKRDASPEPFLGPAAGLGARVGLRVGKELFFGDEKKKRDAEPILGNLGGLIPDFSRANPNDDSPFNPFDDAGLPGKRDAEPILGNLGSLIPDFSKANPNDDSPFNPFDDAGLPGKRDAPPKEEQPDSEYFLYYDSDEVVQKRDASPEPFLGPAAGLGARVGLRVGKELFFGDEKRDVQKREAEPLGPAFGLGARVGLRVGRELFFGDEKRDVQKREAEPLGPAFGLGARVGLRVGRELFFGDKKRDVQKREATPEAFLNKIGDFVDPNDSSSLNPLDGLFN